MSIRGVAKNQGPDIIRSEIIGLLFYGHLKHGPQISGNSHEGMLEIIGNAKLYQGRL